MIKSNNNITFYIAVIIIWIIILVSIFYLFTTIYSNQIKDISEQFNTLPIVSSTQNYWSPTTGPLDRNKDAYFECSTGGVNIDERMYVFGCKWGKV